MLSEDLREQVLALAREVAGEGLEIWDVSLGRNQRGWLVKVTLDRLEEHVSIEDCAGVNGRLRARLELEAILAGAFDLEVSSPGLDRRLRGREDFMRFRGCLARIRVSEGLRPETVVGRIVGVGEDKLVLDLEAGRREVAWDAVAEARLEPELPGFEKKSPPVKKGTAPRKTRGRR
jgi:ribosome maturation factor RimP